MGYNIVRVIYFGVDPVYMNQVYPTPYSILQFQWTVPLQVGATLCVSLVWFRLLNSQSKFSRDSNLFRIIGFCCVVVLFFLQFIVSMLMITYVDFAAGVTVKEKGKEKKEKRREIVISIICVIFLDVTGIKVLLTMNQFRGSTNVNHNRVMRRIALLFIVSTVGILMVTFTIVSFLTQFPYTPWVRKEKNKKRF